MSTAGGYGSDRTRCPLADLPPPPNLRADMPALIRSLTEIGIDTRDGGFFSIFEGNPQKTKLEQFFQLLYFIQGQIGSGKLPITVGHPQITRVLIDAKVFRDPTFPDQIRSVNLERDQKGRPRYVVRFDSPEARFPLNGGIGFAVWERGKCQVAKELVFYDGFSFRLRESGKNLVVDDFDRALLYGDFGTRGIIDLDLNYAELEKVEFLAGTDEGKVKTRVAKREFETNPHSFLFRFVGRLIPDTSRQRIDW